MTWAQSDIVRLFGPSEPLATLYHGAAARFVASTRAAGRNAGRRQYARLSTDPV